MHFAHPCPHIVLPSTFRSQSAIPTTRNNDLAANPRLSRSRQSIRSLKKQAPQPQGPPPKHLLRGVSSRSLAMMSARNIAPTPDDNELDIDGHNKRVKPTAPPPTPPELEDQTDDFPSPPSPLDNMYPDPIMTPYRQYGRQSPKYNNTPSAPKEQISPLALLSLQESYKQPSRWAEREPSCNYHHSTAPDSGRLPQEHSSPDDCEEPDQDAMSTSVVSSEDDMPILRPPARPIAGRHLTKKSNFNPGEDDSPYEDNDMDTRPMLH